MKYNLQNNPILLPHQVEILKLFFATSFAKPFFLTGGTALSAFYLAHRDSKDLDFFSLEKYDSQQLEVVISDIAQKMGCEIFTKVKSDTYNEIYLENVNWRQRIDIVKEQPKRFGEVVDIEGVRIDSLDNIGSNKITAIFGRLEIKDYIDLYSIITQTKYTFEELFELARQKDLGLTEFYFANVIADISQIQTWPDLKIDLDRRAMFDFYQKLTTDMLLKIKPEDK
ncbi:MAG: nucleotidyl transferase AbiEii/AbiGii toxin family protein [Candidatus Amesbacteria bacterium]|nr:nucleotidyl transferase AbiEii/AbiGii toxin family protein [Candidatus Amesbacteria bacterium]